MWKLITGIFKCVKCQLSQQQIHGTLRNQCSKDKREKTQIGDGTYIDRLDYNKAKQLFSSTLPIIIYEYSCCFGPKLHPALKLDTSELVHIIFYY